MKASALGLIGVSVWFVCGVARATDRIKADNAEPLNAGASWVGGTAPTALDVAVWSNNVAGANSSALTNAATWDGVKVLNPGGPVTVGGTGLLTLDGGAAVDINLTGAAQDLAIEAPLAMTNAAVTDVAAGRTLTIKGPLAIQSSGSWVKTGWGTVVFDGTVTSSVATTLELQRGTSIFTGRNGGLSFTSTASGSRIYVGRTTGPATLIISNGFHEARGVHSEANANFVGVTVPGALILEGGGLRLAYLRQAINGGNGDITVNGGTLEVTAGSDTADLSGFGHMIGNNHQDSVNATTGSGTLTVNGGFALFTNGIVKVGSKSATSTGTQTVSVAGGVLAVRRFYIDGCPLVPKRFYLNGGTLRVAASGDLFIGPGLTNGTLSVTVGSAGATIDTGANDVTNAAALAAGGGAGGLTKLGSGTLMLTGANTYAGKTTVAEGLLRFGGAAAALHPDLTLAASGGLSLRDGQLTTFSPAAFSTLYATGLPTLELELAAASASCDVLALPAGAALGHLNVAPVVQGLARRAFRPGDYVIMTYAGPAPDISRLTVLDPAPACSYTFLRDDVAKTVTLRISSGGGLAEWIATGGGAWETASNWSVPPASAPGTPVLLGDYLLASPATVTASSPVTLGGMTVSSPLSYTLAGSGFVFDNGASNAFLNISKGSHSVTAPLTLTGALSVAPASGSVLTLSGAVGGAGSLIKEDAGDLTLVKTNSYAGGTTTRQGSLVLAGDATLGSGPVTVDGGSGFRFVGTAPMTFSNALTLATSAYFTTLSNDVVWTGNIDWQNTSRALIKASPFELALSGTGSETADARLHVEAGVLRLKSGANFQLQSTANRDTVNMKANNGLARSVVIEAGAQLTVSGFDMENGLSNVLIMAGGQLSLLGGGGNNDAFVIKSQGAGIDRCIINSGRVTCAAGQWFGVGYRTGDAYLTVNGGTTSLSRVSLGARELAQDLNARGFVEINGGLLEVTGGFNWMGSGAVGRTNTVTLGNGTPGSGVWRTCATYNPLYASNNLPILVFSGGTLEASGLAAYGTTSLADYLFGAKEVYVGAGGARINTLGHAITVKQPLLKGSASDGGLTKLGAGTLALAGACSFTGATVVAEGSLALPASYSSSSLTLSAGTAMSLANGSIQTQQLGTAVFPTGVTVTFDALSGGVACDQIGLPAGATVGDLSIAVVQAGTAQPVSRAGDYPLFTCAGTPPAVSGWTLLNPAVGRTWSFEVVGSSIVLRLAYAPGASVWTQAGSGDWETAGNWNAAPADAAGTAVRFDGAITAPATVTRASGSTAGSVVFNNPIPYTLAGAALTLANSGDAPAVLEAEQGVHSLSAGLTLTSNALVRAAAGAAVALNGGVSGGAPLTVEGPGALALPDLSGVSLSGLTLTSAGALVVSNSTSLTIPVSLGAGGGVVAPAAGQTLKIESAVTGEGSLTKALSSVLVMTNATAAYSGATKVRAGTVRLDLLPSGGVEFGQGTLHYVGGAASTAGGYTLNTGDDTRAGVLRADGDLTFQGSVSALSGALVKTGPATVTFTAPGVNVFNAGNGAGTSHNVLDIGAYGDSPTTGFSGFNIADGKVVIGATGQTNLFNGLLVVGLNTTTNTDAETAGTLEVVGGVTTVSDTLIIGRSNGTTNTAPVARTSKLLVSGGDLSVGTLVLGRVLVATAHNSAPEAEITGGSLSATNSVIVGEQSGSVATLKLNGGTFLAPNITRLSGLGNVQFNGGVFRPTAEGQTLQGLTSAQVGAGGAWFDLSSATNFTLAQALTTAGADGGLTKTGAGKLTVSGKQLYAGPTTVSEGTLRLPVSGSLSNVTALAVSPGAAFELDSANTQTVGVASLTLGQAASAPATVTLALLSDGSANDRFAVSGPVSLGVVAFKLVRVGLNDAFGLNGTYTLATYAGSDPVTTGLSVANPAYGKTYTFAAASGALTVTVATDYTGAAGGAIWNAATGGSWFDSGNWVVAPGAGGAGQTVLFDDKIASPSTVTLGSAATVGQMIFNNSNAYTLAGEAQLSLDNGAGTQAVVSVETGSHTVSAPLQVPGEGVLVHAVTGTGLTLGGSVTGSGPLIKTSGGTLTAAAASARSGVTEVQGGELILKDGGSIGSGALVMNGATGLRASGSALAALGNSVTLKSAPALAPIIRTEEQALTLSGTLDWQSGGVPVVYKWGTNELVLAGTGGASSGTPKLYVRQGGVTFASGANYTLPGSTRESLKLGLTPNTKASVTFESGSTVKLSGILTSAEAMGTVGNDLLITQNGGSVTLSNTSEFGGDALFLRDWGTATASYVMNGGVFTMPQASWADVGNYGPGRLTVNGGTMTLGRFAAGYQTAAATNGGSAEVTVNGGRLAAAGSWSWMSDGGARSTFVTVNGGTLSLPATRTYGTHANRWAELKLAGGALETAGAALDTSATDDYLAGVRRVALDKAGGTVNTKDQNVTVRQNVLALSSTGGVTKVGAGSLTLAGTNLVWGLVDVQEGRLSARFTHQSLPSAPLFWFGMNSTTNSDLSGNGFALATANASTFAETSRTPSAQGLMFSGDGYFTAPFNPYFTNVTEFTVAAWVLLTNSVSGSNASILSSRPGASRAFELKLMDGNLVRILQHSDATNAWWQEFRTVNAVPVGQWTHVAAVLTPQGVALYLDGVRQSPIKQVYSSGGAMRDYPGSGYYFSGDYRFSPAGSTGGIIIGRPTTGVGAGFIGAMDDLMLFERALSDDELAALASEAPVRPLSLRVAWRATLDMQGSTQLVSQVSGGGQIVNGTLSVGERLAVGDSEGEVPGALLSVANLALGTNVVYACSGDGTVNDLTAVGGLLAVSGAGTISFGRTEANPINEPFTATVMTYGSITGASNLAGWKVTGLGRRGYAATVTAADGRVVVGLKALWGSLLLLK